MEIVIAVVVLLFVLSLLAGTYLTVKAVGAAKRRVDRTLLQTRRTVEDAALRARARARPGPAGELAQLRLRLRTSLRATQEALEAGAVEDASLKESLALFDRLSDHGHELDDDLQRLEAEPDRSALTARLPGLRDRTSRITESADALRWAARDRAQRFAADDLDSLSAQIDTEAGALRHWTGTAPEPDPGLDPGPDPDGGRARGPAHAERPRPDAAPSGSPVSSASSVPAASDDGRRDGPRPALDPAGRRWSGHSWQKRSRPENTT